MAGSQSQTRTSSSSVDPQTRAYVEAYRNRALNQPTYQTGLDGLDRYMNPYLGTVIGNVQREGDRQASMASQYGADQATRAGAYGGSREAVLRGQLIGDVNRNTQNTIGTLSAQGYSDAVNQLLSDRQFAANNGINQLNALTPGFTPTSQTQTDTMTQRSSLLPQILGLGAQIGGGLLTGGASTAASLAAGQIGSSAPRIAQGGGLNFGVGIPAGANQFGWNPQVIRRNPWGY